MSHPWMRFDRDVVLRAGAGAGKTHALVSLYLHLVAGATARRTPVAPGSIVAISFTEKAAAELSDRIRQRVARLAAGDLSGEPELVAAAAAEGVRLPDVDGWERGLQQLAGAPVGTFHRLGGLLLRRHAVAAGIDPEYRQLDEAEATDRLRLAAERAVIAALEASDEGVRTLTAELGFASGGFGGGLIDALLMLHARRAEEGRGAAGLDDNYRPEVVRADWQAASQELLRAARDLNSLPGLGPKWQAVQRGIAAATPGLAALLDQAEAAMAGPGTSSSEAALASARALLEPVKEAKAQGPGVKDAKHRLLEAVDALVVADRGRRAAPLASALARLLDDTDRRYRADKRRLGALDFADLIVRARDLLRDHPEVLAAERARCEVLLVDEFQDTNAVQAELVMLLGGRAGSGSSPATDDEEPSPGEPAGGRLLVVGDRKQSIYEFRGADVGVFMGVEKTIRAGGGTLGVLDRSYRSFPSLVSLSNALFARAFAAPPGSAPARWRIAWDPGTDPLSPARTLKPDEVAAASEESAAELLVVPATGSADERRVAEAAALAARFAALHKEGRLRDAALLLRGFTRLDVYLEALRHVGVPHFVVNGRGFFEAQEIRDLAAALRLLDDPDDRLALCTALRSPLAHQSDETLLRLQLARRLRTEAVADGRAERALPPPASDDERHERVRLRRFATLLDDLRRRADRLGPLGVLRAFADGTELEAVLAAGYQGEQRVANFLALCERARAAEEAGDDLRTFVRRLAELTEPGAGDREAQAPLAGDRDDVLRVMTVHQSKGLQFRIVAVAACGSSDPRGGGPVVYDSDAGLGLKVREGADLEDTAAARRVAAVRADKTQAESLRLFYVAATRARDRLLLSGETGRGGATTWRGLVESALSEEPEVARRLLSVPVDPRELQALAAAPDLQARSLPAGDPVQAAALLARAAERPPVPPPAPVTVAVTQLADFTLCARRYHLLHDVGLDEHPRRARPPSPDSADPELDPLARGTLAHKLLELADPARAGADLEALLSALGYALDAPEIIEVRGHVARFLASPFSRALAAGGDHLEVQRELPFLLSEPGLHGAAVRLRGQIDLLVMDHAEGSVTVVDYKHARAGQGDDYRFQLDAYALAARRLFPGASRVRTGLAFLREVDPSPRLAEHQPAAIEAFARTLAAVGGELARARAEGSYPGRPVEHCRAVGCGYLSRCHRAVLDEPEGAP